MLIDRERFREYVALHYSNQNTADQYIKGLDRYLSLSESLDQESIYKYLGRFTNNTLNRAFLKCLTSCFKIDLEIPKPKSREREVIYRFIKKELIDRMIHESSPRIGMIIRLFFETGLRLSELVNLKREDIDLDKRIVRGVGKGNKMFRLKFSQKSATDLALFLQESDSEYPFRYEGIKCHEAKLWREIKKAGKNIGILDMHPHRIRHSLGHYLRADRGWDMEQIRFLLRHVNLETTRIYSTATREEVERKMENEVFR